MTRQALRLGVTLALAAGALAGSAPAGGITALEVDGAVAVPDARRVGVNLGAWTSWGAEQLSANVVKNPGFEGPIDRTLVVVARAGRDRFADDTPRLARPDGFWEGARYDVRTGPAAGQGGRVAGSRRAAADGLQEIVTDGDAPVLRPGDVVALTRVSDAGLPPKWWVGEALGDRVAPDEPRPGSPGRRSVRLAPTTGQPVEIASYLDAIGHRAGKLLPVTGRWRLEFWARRRGAGAGLAVEFGRHGGPPFVARQVPLGEAWARTSLEFEVGDTGPAGILGLRFRATGSGAHVLVDDVELGTLGEHGTGFRAEVLEALRALRPGYLRDWQGQLADTLHNRLAPPTARRPTRARPGGEESTEFGYSLPDLLALCRAVGAAPWIVVPTTFSDGELEGLGRFLAHAPGIGALSEVVLEFGNEHWNPLFRAGGIQDPARHGEAAQRAFERVRRGAGPALGLRMVVNARVTDPAQAGATLAHAPAAEMVAVAPYFLHALPAGLPQERRLEALFGADRGALRAFARRTAAAGREVAVYEVNLHTLGGDAVAAERDGLTAGAAAGAALGRALVDALAVGVRRQAVWALAGFDTFTADRRGFARLFGITRDLGATGRLRPTGLAVAMLNRALPGDVHGVRVTDGAAVLPALAVRGGHGWSVVLVNPTAEPRAVAVTFPPSPAAARPTTALRLRAPSPEATNEEAERVTIAEEPVGTRDGRVLARVGGWGIVVLVPAEAAR